MNQTSTRAGRWSTLVAGALLTGLVASGPAAAKTFTVDAEHTSVTFRVRHLLTHVEGRFKTFAGTITLDPDAPERTTVRGSIEVASIDTNVAERDKHLRSGDFFNAAEHPKITFASTKVTNVERKAQTAKLHGDLTIRGVTKPVVLDVRFLGEAADPWGNRKAGFSGETTINRKDFGLNWNKTVETGGVLVGDEVQIRVDAEAAIAE